MDANDAKLVADKHRQKHITSCSPSGVELALKLKGIADQGYYELQDQFGGANVGFEPYTEVPVGGQQVVFSRPDAAANFDARLAAVKDRVHAGDFVVVSVHSINLASFTISAHIWVTFDADATHLHCITKGGVSGDQTIIADVEPRLRLLEKIIPDYNIDYLTFDCASHK